MSGKERESRSQISGHELYQWPEFKELMLRLGFEYEQLTTDTVLKIPLDGMVEFVHTYRASVDPSRIETTTAHNESFKTFVPNPLQ